MTRKRVKRRLSSGSTPALSFIDDWEGEVGAMEALQAGIKLTNQQTGKLDAYTRQHRHAHRRTHIHGPRKIYDNGRCSTTISSSTRIGMLMESMIITLITIAVIE